MQEKFISVWKWKKQLLVSCSLFVLFGQVQAQVTGTRVIGVDYPSLAAAITDLNTSGISGAVVINVPGGYIETAPPGGYMLGSTILNATTSSSNTLIIQKNGAGANPLLTAPVGVSAITDGIFFISGTDYVTINGIDLTESVGNTTPTTWMEWGYALVKLQNTAPFDGCNNVSIQNCKIALNRLNTPTVGIYANNHIATATTALAITASSDAMNNCRFYANTIRNTVTGISLRGFAGASAPYTLYDQGNDVGGSGAPTGNTIQNFAGATTGAAINLQYQNGVNVSFNTIDNTAGGGVAATSIVYGVYTQNGTNASVAVTNNNIHLTNGTTSSALYGVNTSCAGTGTININGNTISANGGSTGTMYMIYMGGANTNVNTNSNTFYNINVATSGSLYMVYHSTAATPANITCNNNFTDGPATPFVTKTGTGGTVTGYYNNAGSGSGITTLNNNNFSYFALAGSPTFYGIFENDGGSGQNKFARNNIVSNITSTGGTQYGVYMGFSASAVFSGNKVSFLNPGTGAAYGLYIGSSSTANSVINNHVHDLLSTGGNVYGIAITSGSSVNVSLDTVDALTTGGTTSFVYGLYQTGGTTVNIARNKFYDIVAIGTSGSAYGMYLNSGSVTANNNLVGNIETPNYNGAGGTQLSGIFINGGTAHNLYYNSVYLNTSSSGANFGSSAVYASTTPAVTLRNNIFVNSSTPVGAGITTAYRRSGALLTTYQAASNNNLFYAGTPGSSRVIFYDGTTSYITLPDFKTLVTPRDGNSVTENPPILSLVGASPAFLHISSSVSTQVESGALNIAGITTDFDSSIRAGNPGYTGVGTAPDIGAAEGAFMSTDLSAPNIVYTILPGACTTGDRSFTAAITDATGVPLSGTLIPRVYFRKGSGPWFFSAGTLVSGTATSGTWGFTILAATMGGLVTGDVVNYFVIAQDIATVANIGANPASGLVASDVNTITTYPSTPNSYIVMPVLSGTYNVGVGMAYATITDAVNAYNISCVSGNVIFQLMDAAYAAETLPITINNNASASPANRLTIRPAPGVSPVISGSSSSAVFILNGADYVTIDGANSPVTNSVCPAISSGRDMTIANSSTSTSSAVIWMQTATGADSATHDIVHNCNIAGSGNTFTLFGIGSGGSGISYTSSGVNNNSNRIENNKITATQTGIFSRGASAINKNTGTVINQNELNATSPDNLRNNGIFAGFEDGIIISGNQIANITNSISNDIVGINLGFGNSATGTGSTTGSDVINATVTNNKLDNLQQTNTYSCMGIAVAGVTTGITTIANNMISGVLSNGTSGDFCSGIFIGGAAGGTTRVYYNAVNITGTLTGGSYPSYAISISGTNPIVDLKNNIFVNNASTGATDIYAIGLAYATYSNLSSNHNDFYSVGANMGTVNSLTGSGVNQPALAAWQTTTGNDANSKNINPAFISPSDLHVTAASDNIPLLDAGVPVSVTTDYDCIARSGTTPDIGINEFTIPLCGSVTAGTATPAVPSFCNSGSTAIDLSGATVGIGISYQWQTSPDSVSWTVVSGATSASYVTPSITATTFYRVVLNCSYSGLRDSATTRIIIYPLPVIAVTPAGGGICAGSTGIDLVASGGLSYSWSPATGLSTSTGATVNATPSATTAYTVTGTDVHGCINTHVATVTVTAPPDTFSVSPSPASMCAGSAPLLLSATGAALPASGPDSVTSGLISLTVPDATPGGVATSLTVDGIPTGATITSVSVRFNLNMTYDGDLTLNLTAPNGKTINLVNRRGASGADFINTTVSSAGGILFSSSFAPFTDTYTADAATGAGTTTLPVNTSAWADLYSVPSGTWTFSARDWAGGDVASITSWTLIINYTYNPLITWSPVSGLFTDPGGTVPYTGGAAVNVYAQPADTTIYTATLSLGACSSNTMDTINVNPPTNAGTIVGPSSVCLSSSVIMTNAVAGGIWMSSNPAIATVGSGTGSVSGISLGIDTILYIFSNACGTDTAIKIIHVDLTPVAGSLSGPSVLCVSSNITLTASAPGGVWSASNLHAAVSGTGLVTGVSAGPVIISYTVTNGCGTAVATRSVTVNELPHAGAIAGPASVCEAASIVLTDPILGGTWSSTGGHTTVSLTGLVTGVVAGIDTIKYIVTNSCGADTAAKIIAVNPLPDAGAISGPTAVCVGSSITLTDPASGGVWSSNVHATVSAGLVTGVSGGLDTIQYAVTNSCGTTIASHVVTINAMPDAGSITGPSSLCTADSVAFTDLMSGGMWSSSDPSVSISSTGVATGVSIGSAVISYTVTNMCGTDIAVLPVTVLLSPASFTITGGGTFCAGGIGVPVGLGGSELARSYQLYKGTTAVGAPLAGTGSALDFGLQTAAGTYTVIATNPSSGCNRTMSGTAVIFVNPTVPPTVSISAPGLSVCAGDSLAFTAIPVNGGATPTYQWKVNGLNSGTGVTFAYIPANADVVKVTVTSSSCAVPDTGSASVVVTVGAFAPPSVTITASPGATTCSGSYVTFSAHPVLGGSSPTFRWTKNGVNVATGPIYVYIPTNGDNVYCVMGSNFPCRLADTAISNHIIISVVLPAMPSVSITGHPGTLIQLGQADTLIAVVINGGPAPAYQWFVNGSIVAGATNQVYISSAFANGDVIACKVITSGPCGGIIISASVVLNVANVGVVGINKGRNDIRVMPNPNTGTFAVSGTLATNEVVQLEVRNVLGQTIYSGKLTPKNGIIDHQIQLGDVASGMYLLTVFTQTENLVFHVVIER
jgi:subtilisin-like proprotein convertase family protein